MVNSKFNYPVIPTTNSPNSPQFTSTNLKLPSIFPRIFPTIFPRIFPGIFPRIFPNNLKYPNNSDSQINLNRSNKLNYSNYPVKSINLNPSSNLIHPNNLDHIDCTPTLSNQVILLTTLNYSLLHCINTLLHSSSNRENYSTHLITLHSTNTLSNRGYYSIHTITFHSTNTLSNRQYYSTHTITFHSNNTLSNREFYSYHTITPQPSIQDCTLIPIYLSTLSPVNSPNQISGQRIPRKSTQWIQAHFLFFS